MKDKDKKVIEMVAKCETILAQVEEHAKSIKTMHDHMQVMIEHNKKLEDQIRKKERQEMQKEVMAMASKAAKKAAKKSIAKAKIRERLQAEQDK